MPREKRRISTKLPTRKAVATPQRRVVSIGRNEPCPCGSGKKYKECHLSAGPEFLAKLAQEEHRQQMREKRQQLKEAGVPWHKRIFAR
jgi:SEC-C motif